MNTTALFSEILVGGIISTTWLILVVLGVLEKSVLNEFFGKNQIAFGVVFLAYCYAIGVVLDRVWDWLTKPIDNKVKKGLRIDNSMLKNCRNNIFSDKSEYPQYIEYIRSRMRIARMCLCNSLFLTISGIFCYLRNSISYESNIVILITLLGTAFMISSFYAFRKFKNIL